MKLFAAVVMFVLVSIAVADDVVWQSGSQVSLAPYVYPYESVPPPVDSVASQTHEEVKAQDSQGNAGNSLSFSESLRSNPREEQSDALNYQSMEQLKVARKANKIATRDNEIQDRLVTVGWITIVTMVLLTLAQLYFVWTANQHAAVAALAAKQSVEVADRSMRIANRAYVTLGQWQFEQFNENASLRVHFFLMNSGNTPAKLIAGRCDCEISKSPPLRPNYDQLLRGQAESIPVPGKGEVLQTANAEPMDTATMIGLQQGTVFLYVYGRFIYDDVFGDRHPIEFLVWYDYLTKAVMAAGGQERNHSE